MHILQIVPCAHPFTTVTSPQRSKITLTLILSLVFRFGGGVVVLAAMDFVIPLSKLEPNPLHLPLLRIGGRGMRLLGVKRGLFFFIWCKSLIVFSGVS